MAPSEDTYICPLAHEDNIDNATGTTNTKDSSAHLKDKFPLTCNTSCEFHPIHEHKVIVDSTTETCKVLANSVTASDEHGVIVGSAIPEDSPEETAGETCDEHDEDEAEDTKET